MKHVLAALYLICTIMAICYWLTYGKKISDITWNIGAILLTLNLFVSVFIYIATHPKYK